MVEKEVAYVHAGVAPGAEGVAREGERGAGSPPFL